MTPYGTFLYFGVLAYVVLPAVLLGLLGRLGRWALLSATFFMLAVQYAGPAPAGPFQGARQLWILLAFVVYQWAVAVAFAAWRPRGGARWPATIAVCLCLAPLAAERLLATATASGLFFVGLSYVTFRALDALVAIQDRLVTTVEAPAYLAYLLFFPTISAGPIDRFRRFRADWTTRPDRAGYLACLDQAVHHLFRGLLYKFILAALVQRYWIQPLARASGPGALLSYMYGYSAYLFFDFAGYSAFAVALSLAFGVRTPENFHRPFLARNIRDFWNRWHISLSWLLRDHVYMRFVLAAKRRRLFAGRHTASRLGFVLAMGAMGVWHGLAPRYLLYGLYHGLLLVGHDVFARWDEQRRFWGEGPLWRALEVGLTFHAACFGFLLFSGRLI